jgi:GDPmannose 4,6-dehydratase
MWRILQVEQAEDFVIATGEMHSLNEFLEKAFEAVGLNAWAHVDEDPSLLRPSDIKKSVGDPRKAHQNIGWQPKSKFQLIINQLVNSER